MSQPHPEDSPIESVEPLDDDLATVTVRKFDGTKTHYVASRHSAAHKISVWESQALPGTPVRESSRVGFRGKKDSKESSGESTQQAARAT